MRHTDPSEYISVQGIHISRKVIKIILFTAFILALDGVLVRHLVEAKILIYIVRTVGVVSIFLSLTYIVPILVFIALGAWLEFNRAKVYLDEDGDDEEDEQ